MAAAPEPAADQRLAIRNKLVEQQLQQMHRRRSTPCENPAAFSRLVPEQDQSRSPAALLREFALESARTEIG